MATNLRINGERLWSTLMETAEFGRTAKGGIRRLTLSPQDQKVREWFRAACEALGLAVTVDGMGTMFATRPGRDPQRLAIAFGSHLDTQPAGGKFDGVLGVLAGLEVMRTLAEASYESEAPLTLVNWTDEEGARFAPAMMASGVYAGELDIAAMMDSRDPDGVRFGDALDAIGYRGEEPVGRRRFAAFLELHIEQGPVLEANGETIGVVTGAQGVAWWNGEIVGRDSHAGTTPMPMRKDALVGLAELALACDRIARDHGPAGVCTIGRADVSPGSRNTVPGHVRCQGDFRHPDAAALTAMVAAVHEAARAIAGRRNLAIPIEEIWRKDPVVFDARCVAAVHAAAHETGLPFRQMLSGAGHDSCYVASTCPTAMIFVPCKDGISHNEEEWSEPDACAAGAQVLLGAILNLDADPPRA